jgi:hypothetical protein
VDSSTRAGTPQPIECMVHSIALADSCCGPILSNEEDGALFVGEQTGGSLDRKAEI